MERDNFLEELKDQEVRIEFEDRIGRKLTDEELAAFRLVDKIKCDADRDFGVYVHFHKGCVKIEYNGEVVFEYPEFDDCMQNYVNDGYHLAVIVFQALKLERIGLAEIRDYIRKQISG